MTKTSLAALATFATLACTVGCSQPSALLVEPQSYAASCDNEAPLDRPLKLANYNIKSGVWTSFEEVAAVLEGIDADIIALEEVDNGLPRTDGVDQSLALAERLGAERSFAGAWEKDGGSYGVALLSKLPFLESERVELPEAGGFEPRVAIDAVVCAGPQPLRVVTSHADFLPWSAAAHAEALAERVGGQSDVVLLGDLNIPPDHNALEKFGAGGLVDVLGLFTNEPTFADARIDYVFTDREVSEAHVVDSDASDHKPIWTTMPFDSDG